MHIMMRVEITDPKWIRKLKSKRGVYALHELLQHIADDGTAKVELDLEADDKIYSTWHISDVRDVRPDLNKEKCRNVLFAVNDEHDASTGINWDTIRTHADLMYPKGGSND